MNTSKRVAVRFLGFVSLAAVMLSATAAFAKIGVQPAAKPNAVCVAGEGRSCIDLAPASKGGSHREIHGVQGSVKSTIGR